MDGPAATGAGLDTLAARLIGLTSLLRDLHFAEELGQAQRASPSAAPLAAAMPPARQQAGGARRRQPAADPEQRPTTCSGGSCSVQPRRSSAFDALLSRLMHGETHGSYACAVDRLQIGLSCGRHRRRPDPPAPRTIGDRTYPRVHLKRTPVPHRAC